MSGSPYSFDTAREILAGRTSKTVKVLDRLLGVAILAAGPIGLATGHPWLLAAWSWVDQKNELVIHLDAMVAKGRAKLGKATGKQRYELVAATHTAVVAASFFAALRELTGPASEALTDADRVRLVDGAVPDADFHDAVELLLSTDIALPWAGRGFADNLDKEITPYFERLAERCLAFLAGFAVWSERFGDVDGPRPLATQLVERAVNRYRAEYAALAAEVPEFEIWTMLGEHGATQQALYRLEELVAALANDRGRPDEARAAVAALNRAVLSAPMADLGETDEPVAVRFPTVERGYVEPRFRWAVMDRHSRPSHEDWWEGRPLDNDLATFLAAHFASPMSTVQPLVVLGHPGAGKSLFTKVCAARLSASDTLTTVRVPLREVPDPTVSVYRQIEEVLREATHGRAPWAELCAASRKRTRVVFIDGLDELMQATGAVESRYLQDVVDFQRDEASMRGPVVVVVTSRTVVADLAAIPAGCLVVKLEPFSDEQVGVWLRAWTRANSAAIDRGEIRRLSVDAMLGYGDLVRQPLLLLLLAIVASEQDLPSEGTSARLYQALLDSFVRRELARPDVQVAGRTEAERHKQEMWRLGLVAFGMVNRGRHHLHEQDLAADLAALPGPFATAVTRARHDVAKTMTPARRTVGRFFFIHVAEAEAGAGGRSYEFLHATFADYLIAHGTAEQLRDLHAALSRSAFQQWDDDLLYALLSHRLLAGGGARTLDIFAELAGSDEVVAGVLERLFVDAHQRWSRGRYGDYDPSGATYVQRLAVYTANLILLRVAVGPEPVPMAGLSPAGAGEAEWWRASVRLWRAALSEADLKSVVTSIDAHFGGLGRNRFRYPGHDVNILADWLARDDTGAAARAAGRALLGQRISWLSFLSDHGNVPALSLASSLSEWLASGERDARELVRILTKHELKGTSPSAVDGLLSLVLICICECAGDVDYPWVRDCVKVALQPGIIRFVVRSTAEALTAGRMVRLVVHYPRLLLDVSSLGNRLSREGMHRAPTLLLAATIDDEKGRMLRAWLEQQGGFVSLAESPETNFVTKLPPDIARRVILDLELGLAGKGGSEAARP
jgi:hypothetical protein